MKVALELLRTLQARGVALRTDGDDLFVRPAELVQPAEVDALRRHKAEVLRLLEPRPRPELVAEYEAILGRLWRLNLLSESRHPRARQADAEEARQLLDEQAKLCDELGPELAEAVCRHHA